MSNERITEDLVREHFKQFRDLSGFELEEQTSRRPGVATALKSASKSGAGAGKPEFFITLTDQPNLVIVVECKASTSDHVSPRLVAGAKSATGDAAKYAVDGVLHYASFLSRKFDVVAIAVSGSSASKCVISTYRWLQGHATAAVLNTVAGNAVTTLLSPGEYVRLLSWDPDVARRSVDELTAFSRVTHNFMRDYGKLSEPEKPLVVSAILLALRDPVFRASWPSASDGQLAQILLDAVARTARGSIKDADRRELMLAAYQFIAVHPELSTRTSVNTRLQPNGPKVSESTAPLRILVREIEAEVLPFVETYPEVDVVGQFYGEFLRYTGGDGKGLGIVLTPRHLTELFVDLAQLTSTDIVVDPCAGTGGFLISAMRKLDALVQSDSERAALRERQIVGIEQRTDMYAMCASNMILRGDGRSNLYRGSCFSPDLQAVVKAGTHHQRPTRGLLNPPFSQKGESQHELDFVKAMMDLLSPGGIGVAVVPMSCAIAPHASRERLLKDHTLVATMSLPDELFYPVGIITCALVLRAGQPHEQSYEPTWFGFWKDDGFIKTKNRGRLDATGDWPQIKSQWLSDYFGRQEVPGRCIKRRVTATDEWCAEAYLETDYSVVTEFDLEEALVEYSIFVARSQIVGDATDPDGGE